MLLWLLLWTMGSEGLVTMINKYIKYKYIFNRNFVILIHFPVSNCLFQLFLDLSTHGHSNDLISNLTLWEMFIVVDTC